VSDPNDEQAEAAEKEAKRATLMSWVWWVQLPLVCIVYWFISKEPVAEKLMLIYLAAVSIIAIAVTYASKAQAAEAKKAGYENP
jgi:flagellar basal body-associated protein FliL